MRDRLIWILWPAFVVGGIATMIFFSLFDPMDLPFSDTVLPFEGGVLGENRTMVYSVGFFLFWSMAAASSAFTCFLQKPASDLNRYCPLEPGERPGGCPKPGGADGRGCTPSK